MIGAWVRWVSVYVLPKSRAGALALLFGGQSIAACAQPFVLNSPPKLAAMWFTPEGRATADMVGTIGTNSSLPLRLTSLQVILLELEQVKLSLPCWSTPRHELFQFGISLMMEETPLTPCSLSSIQTPILDSWYGLTSIPNHLP